MWEVLKLGQNRRVSVLQNRISELHMTMKDLLIFSVAKTFTPKIQWIFYCIWTENILPWQINDYRGHRGSWFRPQRFRYIRQISGSNLDRYTGYTDRVYRSFHKSLQVNVRIVLWNKLWPTHSTSLSFPIHHSIIILSSDDTCIVSVTESVIK
jgi:hypothetical protein